MQLKILTSSSEMIPISDFRYLLELARCSKCQMFILSKQNNALFGFPEDCCCIHEIYVPFKVNTDLIFRSDTVDRSILAKYNGEFFVPEKFQYMILPDYYWNMYIAGDIVEYFDYKEQKYLLLDKNTGKEIDCFRISKYIMNRDVIIRDMISQLNAMLSRPNLPYNNTSTVFYNIHQDPVIRSIYDGKSSMGRSLVKLSNGYCNVAFYLYKGLFTLNKADTLDLEVQFDSFQTNLFKATFIPKKKRNPMTLNTYGVPFSEKIHCMYTNIYF